MKATGDQKLSGQGEDRAQIEERLLRAKNVSKTTFDEIMGESWNEN